MMKILYPILVAFRAKKKTSYIKDNAIFYYLMLLLSFIISESFFGFVNLLSFTSCYLSLFALHEVLWYGFNIQLLKNECESTADFYSWCNHFNDGILNISAISDDGYDFSEGIFNGDFTLSNRQAMQNKYDLYYEYLKLQPGMRVLDIGCGNGHWGHYLVQKGIDFTGIVISKDNHDECLKKGLKVILGDARLVIKDIKDRFDAVSAIGPIEHFSSLSQPLELRINGLHDYFENIINLIDKNSKSKMYLNSIMTTNTEWSKYKSLEFRLHFYLIASAFGSGYYPTEKEIESVYATQKSKIVVKRDYTEDYRYIFVRDEKYLGNFNWLFNTPKRIYLLGRAIFSDPYWLHRILFATAGSWLWQFGGKSKQPMPEYKDTPIRSYIYVAEIYTPST